MSSTVEYEQPGLNFSTNLCIQLQQSARITPSVSSLWLQVHTECGSDGVLMTQMLDGYLNARIQKKIMKIVDYFNTNI